MSYTSLLINSCTIERYTEGASTAYGKARTWSDHLTSQACRVTTPTGREITVHGEVVIADYKLFTQDIDVTEQDRVIVDSITYEILLVKRRSDGAVGHHKELFIQVVR